MLAHSLDHTHHLVPGLNRPLARRKFSFDHMQIGPADSARTHPNKDLLRGRLRFRQVDEFQRIGFNRRAASG
jgi:hypothetical protein